MLGQMMWRTVPFALVGGLWFNRIWATPYLCDIDRLPRACGRRRPILVFSRFYI
jgi:hypothetical protein